MWHDKLLNKDMYHTIRHKINSKNQSNMQRSDSIVKYNRPARVNGVHEGLTDMGNTTPAKTSRQCQTIPSNKTTYKSVAKPPLYATSQEAAN